MVHFSGNHNASLSEGAPLAVVVRDFPETPHGTRDNTDFRVPCEKAMRGFASRVPLPPGATARRTRGVLVEGATPPFSPLVRHRGGVNGPPFGPPFTPPLRGGRSVHSDPCGLYPGLI